MQKPCHAKVPYDRAVFYKHHKRNLTQLFSDTIKGVNRTISEEYNLFVRAIDDLKSFETITPMRYDGIILMSQSDSDNSFIYHIREKNIPLVVLNRDIDDRSITNILSNDKEGSRQAVDCLIANGHRDIAIIEGKEGFRSTSQRKEGYLTSLIDHSIPIKHEYSVKGRYDMESGSQAMENSWRFNHRLRLFFVQTMIWRSGR